MPTFSEFTRRLAPMSTGVLTVLLSCDCGLSQDNAKFVSRENAALSQSYDLDGPTSASPVDMPELYLQGICKPSQDAELRPNTQGIVREIHVREGQWVKAGTPLVTFSNSIAKAAVSVAKAAANARAAMRQAELAMVDAKSILSRTEIALRANASSEFEIAAKKNQYLQAAAAYEQQVELARRASAELKLAEAQLSQLTLSAPFDGEVLSISAKLGNTIDPTQVAVRIANLDELQVEMHLPLSIYGKIKEGESYQFKAAAPVDRRVQARARYVSRVVEPTSGTFRASFEIDNSKAKLPAGFEMWFQSL